MASVAIVAEKDLLDAARQNASSSSGNPRQLVMESLSPRYQRFLASQTELTSDQKAGLAMELNGTVIMNDSFHKSPIWSQTELPEDVQTMMRDDRVNEDPATMFLLNRRLLAAALPGTFLPDFSRQPGAALVKVIYSFGYGLGMWLLVLAAIGGFQHFFDKPSPLSRYLADSAYWVYIVHLPILFQIEVWVAHLQWGLGGVPKFLFYNIVATFFCFASYHFLVRSTFIGRILNGRTYPLVLWPRRRSATPATEPGAMPEPHMPLSDTEHREAAARPARRPWTKV